MRKLVATLLVFFMGIASSWSQEGPSVLRLSRAPSEQPASQVIEKHKASEDEKNQPIQFFPSANVIVPRNTNFPSPQTRPKNDAKNNNWRDWVSRFFTEIKITDALLVLFTGLLWWSTDKLWKATHGMQEAAATQADAMERSITEAANSAKATGIVAEAMSNNTKLLGTTVETNKRIADRQVLVSEMQLRAYVSVIIGTATYQDRGKNLRFEGKPVLVNSGQTPAREVTYAAKAAILAVPLPEDFVLTLSTPPKTGRGMIPAHQDRTLSAVVDDYIPDDDVPKVMRAVEWGLYVWGVVTYEDAFQEKRRTEFCHLLTFRPNNAGDGHIVDGQYIADRNTAT